MKLTGFGMRKSVTGPPRPESSAGMVAIHASCNGAFRCRSFSTTMPGLASVASSSNLLSLLHRLGPAGRRREKFGVEVVMPSPSVYRIAGGLKLPTKLGAPLSAF